MRREGDVGGKNSELIQCKPREVTTQYRSKKHPDMTKTNCATNTGGNETQPGVINLQWQKLFTPSLGFSTYSPSFQISAPDATNLHWRCSVPRDDR